MTVPTSPLADSDVSDWVGETIDILSDRGRKLSDDAAEGLAAYVRHCDGGVECATNARDLIAKFPSNVADDSTESVKTAFKKSYGNELVDTPGGPNHDPFGKKRVDEAAAAARATLHPHLRNFVTPHIGANQAIKSMEEFEALRFMRAENLTDAQR